MSLSCVVRARSFLHTNLLNTSRNTIKNYSRIAHGAQLENYTNQVKNDESEPLDVEDGAPNSDTNEFKLDPEWKQWWNGSMKYHPGRCKVGAVSLPTNFADTAQAYLKEYYNLEPQSKVFLLCKKLCDVLAFRPLPVGFGDDSNKRSANKYTVSKKDIMSLNHFMTKEEKREAEKKRFRSSLWRQIVYDRLNTVAYLIGRAPATYASTLRVLIEIKRRDKHFHPKSMLDYGSGVGTAVWAANSVFGKDIEDFMCVDWSQCMNQTSQFLLTGGGDDAEISGIYIRPMLPLSYKHSYDMVVAAYTLSELPSEKERLTTLKLLWEKTNKYLVIIEQGNRPGYDMVMEARNLIVHGIEGADLNKNKRSYSKITRGHIFAPCPHSKPCPKFQGNSCSFTQSYIPPMYAKKFHGQGATKETFTYIILSKEEPDNPDWPRVMDDADGKLKKMWCHLCANDGQIHHVYINKERYSSDIRRMIKSSKAGDRLPYQKPNKYSSISEEEEDR